MTGVMQERVDRYVELPGVPREKPKTVIMLSFDEKKISDDDIPRVLSTIVAKVVADVLCAARRCRYDFSYHATVLAGGITRWTGACDKRLFRLMCYNNSTITLTLASHVGDCLTECKILPPPT